MKDTGRWCLLDHLLQTSSSLSNSPTVVKVCPAKNQLIKPFLLNILAPEHRIFEIHLSTPHNRCGIQEFTSFDAQKPRYHKNKIGNNFFYRIHFNSIFGINCWSLRKSRRFFRQTSWLCQVYHLASVFTSGIKLRIMLTSFKKSEIGKMWSIICSYES